MDLQHFNSQRADSLFKKKIKKKSMNSYQDYFFPCSVELKKKYREGQRAWSLKQDLLLSGKEK